MKKFYNQESKNIKEFQNYQVLQFQIDIPSLYGLNYYKELDSKMKDFVKGLEPTDMPTVFQIVGDFSLIEKHADDEDKVYFLMSLTNLLVSHIITKERTEGEFRLSAPKSLADMKLNSLVKKDLANKVLLFPNFTIDVADLNGKTFYGVL